VTGYDIIGDVHGNADKLEALLVALGYRMSWDGAWRHPERTAVFVGDLIDRGPGQLRTIDIARRMREAGAAHIVLGNHEFNAVAWATDDPDAPGSPLRTHSDKNRDQHEAFLTEVDKESGMHRKLVEWFHTIPLWLDLGGVRVIHACWHEQSMRGIAGQLRDGCLTTNLVVKASRRGSPEHEAIEVLLKGPEVDLPHPHHYMDKGGTRRTRARLRWWDPEARTYATAAHIPEGSLTEDGQPMPPLPDEPLADVDAPVYDSHVPLVVGHYWFSGDPEPMHARVACVDYSVGRGGPLVAYRWDGEDELRREHFVAVG
jgi:hypothetical protein